MKRRRLVPLALLLSAFLLPLLPPAAAAGAPPVTLTIVQMNDVYEIGPVGGGREGGLARVATIRRQLLAEDPNTLTVLSGDLFSPSALGTARVDGERLAGRQIVATMNVLGLDWATFGNHEFDVPEKAFLDRLRESRFSWVSSNCRDRRGQPFPGVRENAVVTVRGAGGAEVRVGLFGVTLDSNKAEYVTYADPVATARAQVAALRGRADVVVALTHLAAEQDAALAREVPGIDLILGGHEHENMLLERGAAYVPICKADANARTVYVHRLSWDPAARVATLRSELRRVTAAVPDEPATLAEVRRWQELGFAAFRAEGFEPERVVAEVPIPLDGLEASVRNRPTELTGLIADALRAAVPDAELALFNSGSVRIDDLLPPGPLTEFDIIRILPFGGRVCRAEIEGGLLRRVLAQGRANRGQGGFLQVAGAGADGDRWLVNGEPVADGRVYRVATSDFLLSGREQGLEFLSDKAPGVRAACTEGSDIRFAFRDHLRQRFGTAAAPAR
jgi:5'-nucleotidase